MLNNFKLVQSVYQKLCLSHHRQATYFCSKLDCLQNTYLCHQCIKGHKHKEMILDWKTFIQKIFSEAKSISLMQQEKRIWDYENILKQMLDKVTQLINDVICKIKEKQFYKYFINQNILNYKLQAQQSQQSIKRIKQQLYIKKSGMNNSNFKKEIEIMIQKIQQEIIGIKTRIDYNTKDFKISPPINSKVSQPISSQILCLSQKKIYTLACIPHKIFSYANRMIVCSLNPPSYLYDIDQKTAIPINFSVSLFSACDSCFFAISPPSTILKFNFDGVQTDQFVAYKQNISSICCYQIGETALLATGYYDGMLQVYGNRSRLYSQQKYKDSIISLEFTKNFLFCAFSNNRIILIYSIKNLNLQLVDSITHLIQNIQGLSFFQNNLLFWNMQSIISLNITTKQYQQIYQPSTDILCSIVDNNKIIILINSNSLLKALTFKQIFKQHKIHTPVTNVSGNRNSMIIHKDKLWILKKDSADVEVFSITFK